MEKRELVIIDKSVKIDFPVPEGIANRMLQLEKDALKGDLESYKTHSGHLCIMLAFSGEQGYLSQEEINKIIQRYQL